MTTAPTGNSDDKTMLVKWFVSENREDAFQDYNSTMTKMVSRKIVGDDATTNFLTARWISTMIAVEATVVCAFMAIQKAFTLVTSTPLQAMQLDFKAAFETFKENTIVTILALKVTISMVPLILLGAISPSTAYAKIAGQLNKQIEAKEAAAKAASVELNKAKELVAPLVGLTKEAALKLTPEELRDNVAQLTVTHNAQIDALASAAGMAAALPGTATDADQLTARITALQAQSTVNSAPLLLAVDNTLRAASGEEASDILLEAEVRTARLQAVIDKTAQLAEVQAQLTISTEALTTAKTTLDQQTLRLEELSAQIATHAEVKRQAEEALAELADLKRAKATVDARLIALEEQLKTASIQTKAESEEIALLKANLAKAALEIVQKMEMITQLRESLEQSKALPAEGVDPTATLKAQLESVREEAMQKHQAAQRNALELQQQIEETKRQLGLETTAKAQLEETLKDLKLELAAQKQESATISTALNEKHEALILLQGRFTTVDESAKTAMNAARIAAEEKATLQEQVQVLTESKAKLKARLVELQAQQASQGTNAAEIARLKDALAATETNLATKTQEVRALTQTAQQMERAVQIANSRLFASESVLTQQLVDQNYFLPEQVLSHAAGLRRAELVTGHVITGESNVDTGTILFWDEFAHTFTEYTKSANVANPPAELDTQLQTRFYTPGYQTAIDSGNLYPYPTGVSVLNRTESGQPWLNGPNTVITAGLFVNGEMIFFKTDIGELLLPLTATKDHLPAVMQMYGSSTPVVPLLGEIEGTLFETDEHTSNSHVSSQWATDFSWEGHETRRYILTSEQFAALNLSEIAAHYGMSVVSVGKAYDPDSLANETMPDNYAFYAADALMDVYLPVSSATSTVSTSHLPGEESPGSLEDLSSATGGANPEGITVPHTGDEESLMSDGARLNPNGSTSEV